MSFPTKEIRAACWSARDKYWECLDKYENSADKTQVPSQCVELRKFYEESCPSQWIKHFDRKRNYLQFKQQIEKHGYEPLNSTQS